ncbi:1,4-alpha-glucan branching enzyme [Streptomyces sp. NPDC059852]|uniref:1,4-alpha-glucan branching enzyme n=1 Tax=Streptomyces sp. NPDC059852 TaxID=3346972 RepID=UPI00365039D5
MTPRTTPSSGPDPQHPAGTPTESTPAESTPAAKKATAKKATTAKKAAPAGKSRPAKAVEKAVESMRRGVAKKAAPAASAAKKTAAKKTAAKRAPVKAAARKAAPKGVAAEKAVTKKAVAKKAPAQAAETTVLKKAAAKKAPAEKTVAEKTLTKKTVAKKTVAKKAVAKKTAAKKTVAKKAVAKKAATEKTVAKKTATTEAAARKTAAKQTVARQATARTPAKAAAGKGAAPTTPAAGGAAPRKAGARKIPAQQAAQKKIPAQQAAEGTPGPGSPAEPPAPVTVAGSAALDAADRDRLLSGTHHDPHSVLGAHPVPGGVAFRAFRPFALSVTVAAGAVRAELHDDGDGFFTGLLPLRDVPQDYRLLVAYEGSVHETEDAYRFLPALGELDLHLIGEGRHEELWKALGAQPMTHQGVTGTRFTVWAPNARGVSLAGTFNYWDGTGFPLRSLGGTGVWELFVPGVGEGELYKFEITRPDGSKTLRADPMARRTEAPPNTSSIVCASEYEWGDAQWLERRGTPAPHEAPFSVYEVHLASWRPGLTYRQLAEQLPAYVKDLGFTHVELMPVAEHPFGGSWGYQVTGFYAPTARLGTPDDFKYLVDRLHQAGIGVLMDWVPAHFPRDDWALAEFDGRPLYEHEDPLRSAHPDWGTLEFDFGRREVRNFLVANAVYWCEEFHIDGLRVDAVASMLYLDYSREPGQWVPNEHGGRENLDAVAFLQEMNATVYRRNPGIVTIAEESTAWDGVTRPTHVTGPGGFGGLGFGLKWNMGWMHDSLEYMTKEPVHRRYHHDEMTFSMVYAYSENYVLPISHDEVVHGKRSLVSKMPGDWWQQRANLRAYLGFMWAHPGKQLLFMGQEFAQGAEWSEAHGPDWWLLDPAYGAEADHRGVRDLVRDLNTVYRHTPALWQRDTDPSGFRWVVGDAADDNVFAFLRYDAEGAPLLAVSNMSPVVRDEYRVGVPEEVPAWHEVVNTDAARYGGGDVVNPEPVKPDPQSWHGCPASIRLTLPPLATVWLRPA